RRLSNWVFEICESPTTTTAPVGTDDLLEPPPPPPQPAAARPRTTSSRGAKRAIFMEKAASCCLPHVEDSIDNPDRFPESVPAQGNLAAGGRVDSRIDARAQLAQLAGAE